MKFPTLFKKSEHAVTRGKDAQDRAEKLLVESFRLLGQVCGKMADFIEAQRLARAGFETQGKYLERLDVPPVAPKKP